MPQPISVVDLFAGPGGLAEGFAAAGSGASPRFRIALSVEKEATAFKTLRLRSFYRQFNGNPPQEYYDYIAGRISRSELESRHSGEWNEACRETHQLELGGAAAARILDPLLNETAKTTGGHAVLVGGPPCQAYSLVGRARNRGVAGYVPSEDHRHFLYREYIRILKRLNPAVFVMENVKGILSSAVDGSPIFDRVLDDLRSAGGSPDSYRIVPLAPQDSQSGYVIKSELHGIPQTRHRVILLGIRSDITTPEPGQLNLRQSDRTARVTDVLQGMPALRSGLSRGPDDAHRWSQVAAEAARVAAAACSTMDGPANLAAPRLREVAEILGAQGNALRRSSILLSRPVDHHLAEWLSDDRLEGLPNHDTRGHMSEDLARYAFVSVFAEKFSRSPKAAEFPARLAPRHDNWESGKFVDRFRAQRWDAPSSTITSHISKDGHYFIHPDPTQCRSLTVREAARLQTFPDNYYFEGGRTAQYVQVGNAVPPLLARQIASIVADIFQGGAVRAAA